MIVYFFKSQLYLSIKHAIRLSCNLNGIPDTITADERKLKQVMYNLLSNAVKFTPDSGEIRLVSQVTKSKQLIDQIEKIHLKLSAVDFERHKEWIEIQIQDTGIGFKSHDADRIFHPFEQLESSKNLKYKGTGLGLSLTKQFIELHNGKIWAESEGQDKGSTFHIVIPRK